MKGKMFQDLKVKEGDTLVCTDQGSAFILHDRYTVTKHPLQTRFDMCIYSPAGSVCTSSTSRFVVVEETNHHVHHDLIIAWAKGAEIEYMAPNGAWGEATPCWDVGGTYRIKPKVVKELTVAEIEELLGYSVKVV